MRPPCVDLPEVVTVTVSPRDFRPGGSRTKADRDQEADARRGSSWERGYNVPWRLARKGHLFNSPICRWCKVVDNIHVSARVVDHWFPHKGDTKVFWTTAWWVSLCTACHSGRKQALERRGHAALVETGRCLGLDL